MVSGAIRMPDTTPISDAKPKAAAPDTSGAMPTSRAPMRLTEVARKILPRMACRKNSQSATRSAQKDECDQHELERQAGEADIEAAGHERLDAEALGAEQGQHQALQHVVDRDGGEQQRKDRRVRETLERGPIEHRPHRRDEQDVTTICTASGDVAPVAKRERDRDASADG